MSTWDEVDQWIKQHPNALAHKPRLMGPRRPDAYRARAEERIKVGLHPFGGKLREPQPDEERGQTCGTCAHLVKRESSGKVFFKCAKYAHQGRSAASDCRKKWPACFAWSAKP